MLPKWCIRNLFTLWRYKDNRVPGQPAQNLSGEQSYEVSVSLCIQLHCDIAWAAWNDSVASSVSQNASANSHSTWFIALVS